MKKKIAPTEAQAFLDALKGNSEIPLKYIARALHRATGGRQEAVLTLLQKGHIVASTNWPTATTSIEIPPALWTEIQASAFKIRWREAGRWRTSTYSLPSYMLQRYLVTPLIIGLTQETHSPDETKQLLSEAVVMLNSATRKSSIYVTFANARNYAETFLASRRSIKKAGRPKTLDAEFLLLEAFRRIHLKATLPSQKKFVGELTNWWNDDPSRSSCSTYWVEGHVKKLWAALRRQ